ncbi:lytic transglycosylase domain-containing protein [Crenalkalicoccus roseus]|uniref:lytic transglycosylase domain-containing protein n=1 Tax=Crenalkalicoccus roseus TaxID=1485588 RepID=UPI0013050722|nr:lytic transglycosylase domain-containing protein [Crenalkalicoccus roseus]
MRRLPALAAWLALLAAPAAAAPDPWRACGQAIARVEPGSGLPPGLLGAIAQVESGRPDARGRRVPWPWAYNAQGEGRWPETEAAARAEVAALLAAGVRSVDVGCMQVNLLHHPAAFASLEEAFDPEANIRYAARLLRSLHARSGNWAEAIALYHSARPEHGLPYHRRVALARLGTSLDAARSLCAPGLSPALALRGTPARPRVVCRRPGRPG